METKVGIRELKNSLSRYVRQAAAGDVILVTDHGRVVAELAPPGSTRRRDVPAWLLDLERRGLVRLASRPNHPSLYRRMPHVDLGDKTIEDLMDELRGD